MEVISFAHIYEGEVRKAVLALKNGNDRRLARDLASLLEPLATWTAIDLITWAPTTARRVRDRGYDHAELIARSLAKRVGVPPRRLLLRNDHLAQQGRSRAERQRKPVISASPLCCGKRIAVIDDVVTTGTTLLTCREALENAGAQSVALLAVAGANR